MKYSHDLNVTKTIKHFRLKIKTKTKSKMPAKINTDPVEVNGHHLVTNIFQNYLLCFTAKINSYKFWKEMRLNEWWQNWSL